MAEKLAAAKPFGRFVGNGLDRSVLPCQKYDTAGKPRTAGCADGSRPIPTNIPKTDSFYTLHLSFQGRGCLRFSTFQQTLSIVLFCGFARGFPQFQHGFPHFHSGKMSKTCAKCGESPPKPAAAGFFAVRSKLFHTLFIFWEHAIIITKDKEEAFPM
uniref:hypothetical protein n=1 Tax=Gemmiger formicilis TaxID=745368 RepID=UPI004028E6B7